MTGAHALVDAAGPFQGAPYTLALATAEARLDYVDIADARDFVDGPATAMFRQDGLTHRDRSNPCRTLIN
jgi:hypothetical protein